VNATGDAVELLTEEEGGGTLSLYFVRGMRD